ncbi:MAG: GTPase ObgE [Ignavibacteriae bacterium]|nr:GTPase ObgE [Ignavibacteriota bacterium]
MNFIDTATVEISSGKGGRGHISFRHEKSVANGGPDGGNGGKGGNVIVVGDPQLATLMDFRYRRNYHAEDGNPGEKYKCTGRSGNDLVIKLPLGTVVHDAVSGKILADLDTSGKEIIIARGGRGGRGNAEFMTPTNQAPRNAEPGEPAEELSIVLELKILADVGIVGFPNAGKSTLISVISAAKPKIADYPFTTLIPNLGMVRLADGKSYTVADIPGLIEGAHEGRGLGIQFLRHIERTRVLVFMLDAANEDIKKDYKVLCNELKKYSPEMLKKPQIVCISKTDTVLEEDRKNWKRMKFGGQSPFPISAATGDNIDELKWKIWEILKGENKI